VSFLVVVKLGNSISIGPARQRIDAEQNENSPAAAASESLGLGVFPRLRSSRNAPAAVFVPDLARTNLPTEPLREMLLRLTSDDARESREGEAEQGGGDDHHLAYEGTREKVRVKGRIAIGPLGLRIEKARNRLRIREPRCGDVR
jgi:hypothetical protein